jgi:hypothetical protein
MSTGKSGADMTKTPTQKEDTRHPKEKNKIMAIYSRR